jgi:O-antigen/teichoic acid export membrane protein
MELKPPLTMPRRLLSEKDLASMRRLFPIAREYLASGITMTFSAVCQFAWFVILARSLGVSEFGALTIITAICALAAAFSGVGSGDAIIRHTARDRGNYPAILGHGLLVIAVTGVVLSAVSVAVLRVPLGAQTNGHISLLPLILFAVTNIIVANLIGFAQSIFLGFGDMRVANLIEMGFSLVRFLSAAIGCLAFGVASLDAWAIWTAGAHFIMLAVCALIVKPLGRPIWQVNRHELGLGFHYCTPRILDAMRVNSDRIVLGIVVPATALANYAVAARMAQVSQLVVNSLNRIVYPRFASRKKFGLRRIRPMATLYLATITTIAGMTAVCIYIMAPLLPRLLDSHYENVVFNLRVLCWLIIPLAIQTVPYDLLGAFDRHKARANLYNSASIAGAATTALLVYFRGISGAFLAAYVVESGLAICLWALLFHLGREETSRALASDTST